MGFVGVRRLLRCVAAGPWPPGGPGGPVSRRCALESAGPGVWSPRLPGYPQAASARPPRADAPKTVAKRWEDIPPPNGFAIVSCRHPFQMVVGATLPGPRESQAGGKRLLRVGGVHRVAGSPSGPRTRRHCGGGGGSSGSGGGRSGIRAGVRSGNGRTGIRAGGHWVGASASALASARGASARASA